MDMSFNHTYSDWDSIEETNWPSSFSNTFYLQGNNFIFNNDENNQNNENNYENDDDLPTLESNEIFTEDFSQNFVDFNNDQENYQENQLTNQYNNNNIIYSLLNRPARSSNRESISFIFQRRTRRRRISPLEDIILNPLNSTLVNYTNDQDQDYTDQYQSTNNPNQNNDNIILNNNLSPLNLINADTEFISNYDSDNSIIRTILENSFSTDKNKYKSVLDDPSGNIIKIVKFNSLTNINSSCPIFQLDFQENEEVAILPCKHCFTIEAITKWLNEQKAECPVCREQFSSKEVSDENINSLEESEETPLLPETYFRNNDLTETIRSMLDIIYERNEERQLQQVLLESTYSNS